MRVHHVAVAVTNLEVSSSFYKEHFGFVEERELTKPDWNRRGVLLKLGDMRLELFEFTKPVQRNASSHTTGLQHIGIEVSNVQEVYEQLQQRGVDIDEPKKGSTCAWYCFLRDPDGIILELYESK